MPRNVVLFERIGYLSLAFGLISSFLNAPTASITDIVVASIFILGLNAVLIWLAARKRKSWARSLLIGLVIMGTVFAILITGFDTGGGLAGNLAYYLAYITSLISTGFLMTPSAGAWVRKGTEVPTA